MSDEPMTDKPNVFVIEDELHAEPHGKFPSFRQAVDELRRLAVIPWNAKPNRAPCSNWKACGRNYEVVEYDESWTEVRRVSVLEVSASGAKWSDDLDKVEAT
ncbi:MAG TPA: hypothetical protein VFG04_17970 [Planctomycetaceae bacterium]|jgi:hypothetical protein|nr:hypothetical protein [Planctomycetaceae bacterium]